MKLKKSFFTVIILVISIFVSAQYEKQIDSIFAEYNNSPGCAIAVYQDGKIVFSNGYGYANLDYDIKITPSTVFDIGSISKQFTATCMLLLEKDGKLSIDDDVRKYIPELPKYSDTIITIKHLIHHTSGIRSYLALQYISGIPFENNINKKQYLELITAQKALNFGVGEQYLYCNSGYFLMGVIVKRITGKTIGEFAKERIFEPLGMKNTFYYEDAKQVIKNRAIAYFKEDSVTYKRNHIIENSVAGAGGIHTTVEDFQKWDENFYTQKIGGENYYKTMHTRGILNSGDTISYAFGLGIGKQDGLDYAGHSGGWGSFVSNYTRYTDHHFSVVGFSNFGFNPAGKLQEVVKLYLGDKMEIKEKDEEKGKAEQVKISTSQLEKMVGRYELKEQGITFEATVESGILKVLQIWDKAKYSILPTSDTTFVLEGKEEVVFTAQAFENGKAGRFNVNQNNRDFVWSRIEEVPKKVDVSEYAGNFYSEELKCEYELYAENDTLKLVVNYLEPISLTPSKVDVFTSNLGGSITYLRKKGKNKIIGLKVDAGRAQGILFDKKD